MAHFDNNRERDSVILDKVKLQEKVFGFVRENFDIGPKGNKRLSIKLIEFLEDYKKFLI
jgi:hypothetical protein